jgi:hypothetical protein
MFRMSCPVCSCLIETVEIDHAEVDCPCGSELVVHVDIAGARLLEIDPYESIICDSRTLDLSPEKLRAEGLL